MKDMPPEHREKRYRNVGDPERRARYVSTFEQGVESHYVFEGIAIYEQLFKKMERSLAHGKDWLLGDNYTLADISISPYIARLHYLTILDIWMGDRPFSASWWERARNRSSFRVSIENALKDEEKMDMHRYGSGIRDRVWERRKEYISSYI